MNSLEAEYSFLAPTWKLPIVATPSMYSRTYGTTYSSDGPDLGADLSLWNNTMYNSRYIPSYVPSTTARRNFSMPTNQQRIVPPYISSQQQQQQQNYQVPDERVTQSGPPYYQQTNNEYENNEYESNTNRSQNQKINRGLTYATHGQNNNRGLTYATNGQNNQPQPPGQNYQSHPPGQNYQLHPPSQNNQLHPPGQNYQSHPAPPGQKRRVQIIDQNRQTPSTVGNGLISSRNSYNSTNGQSYPTSDIPKSQQKTRQVQSNQNRDHTDESRFGYQPNNTNNHEYLYGISEPDSGSYANAFKTHQRRLQDEKHGRKSVINEYKSFAQNGGFGPSFNNRDHQNYEEKIGIEQKRKIYSKQVRETNQYKIEEQKRTQNNPGQQKNRLVPVPKYQRAREYADKIERPHNLKPVSETEFSSSLPVIITSLSNNQRRSSLDTVLNDGSLIEFNINRSRRSSSISSIRTQRRVRFHSRDFIRRRSSTFVDLPSHIIGKSIPYRTDSLSARYRTEKSAAKILDEQEKFHFKDEKNSSKINEKKIITSHSMNMRLPPTANVVINQTYKPSILPTTNNQLKKSNLNKDIRSSSRQLTARSIPDLYRKSTESSNSYFDLKIKSFHHADDENDSSNE